MAEHARVFNVERRKEMYSRINMGCDIHSYGTFGFLADVRNYFGLTPIAEQRGMPEDTSAEVAKAYKFWGSDATTRAELIQRRLHMRTGRGEDSDIPGISRRMVLQGFARATNGRGGPPRLLVR